MAKIPHILLVLICLGVASSCDTAVVGISGGSDALTWTPSPRSTKNSEPIPIRIPDPIPAPIETRSACIQRIYTSYIGVREIGCNNCGPEVSKFLASVGLPEGNKYCSAFVAHCLDSCGVRHGVNAWSPTAENRKNLIYKNGKWSGVPEPGDVITIFYPRMGRIGHAGFYDHTISDVYTGTVEANVTSSDLESNDGGGVSRMRRMTRSLNSISRWH